MQLEIRLQCQLCAGSVNNVVAAADVIVVVVGVVVVVVVTRLHEMVVVNFPLAASWTKFSSKFVFSWRSEIH